MQAQVDWTVRTLGFACSSFLSMWIEAAISFLENFLSKKSVHHKVEVKKASIKRTCNGSRHSIITSDLIQKKKSLCLSANKEEFTVEN
jgi:hypothetical protein